ncbi:DUF6691 family protein [Halobacteriovorax sp. HLS]|uniref:DUF6691 family protein n=1 Tax=Halobacteriovorax sp. HLS TaxID=2234000 RepID=UPI000FDBE4A6|nr:DUF6691 family protein [Halobacteriovorax sp. HLS]
MKVILSMIAGVIFSFGLVISGMINPDKVIGFLDIFGQWDYALAFVMGGAVIFNLITFKLLKKKDRPFFNGNFEWPTRKDIDSKLIIGSALFGIGWGLIGICPGPGIVNLISLDTKVFTFVGSMVAGMLIFKIFTQGVNK